MNDTDLDPLDPCRPLSSLDDMKAVLYRIRLLTAHVIALQKRVDELERTAVRTPEGM